MASFNEQLRKLHGIKGDKPTFIRKGGPKLTLADLLGCDLWLVPKSEAQMKAENERLNAKS